MGGPNLGTAFSSRSRRQVPDARSSLLAVFGVVTHRKRLGDFPWLPAVLRGFSPDRRPAGKVKRNDPVDSQEDYRDQERARAQEDLAEGGPDQRARAEDEGNGG